MAVHKPCPKCESTGRHKNTCPRLAEIKAARAAGQEPAKPRAPAPTKGPAPRVKTIGRTKVLMHGDPPRVARPHEALKNREVLELIRQHEAALVELRAELRERRDEIAAALGETTAVTRGLDGEIEAA